LGLLDVGLASSARAGSRKTTQLDVVCNHAEYYNLLVARLRRETKMMPRARIKA